MASLGLAYLLTGDGDCSPRLALVILTPVAGSSRVLLHRKTKFSLSSCGLVLVSSCTVIKYA